MRCSNYRRQAYRKICLLVSRSYALSGTIHQSESRSRQKNDMEYPLRVLLHILKGSHLFGQNRAFSTRYGRLVIFKSLKYPTVPISTHNATDPLVVDPFIFSTMNEGYF